MNKNIILLLFFCVVFVVSCDLFDKKKNEAIVPVDTTKYNPEKYVFDIPFYLGTLEEPISNPTTKQGVELGRHLFFDTRLSIDNTVSCGTCHRQNHAFADDILFSKGVQNRLGKRQSMPIMNLAFLDSGFFWDGRAKSLEHQVLFPIEDHLEMDNNIENVVSKLKNDAKYKKMFFAAFGTDTVKPELIYNAIAQFERTMLSLNSKYDRYYQGTYVFTSDEKKGLDLFYQHPFPERGIRGGNCGDCHSGFLQTDENFRNNGLDSIFNDLGRYNHTQKSIDKGKFRVPSLRNIALTAPYMHDGRFNTLEEVLDHYSDHFSRASTTDPLILAASNNRNGKTLALTAEEKRLIIVFLNTLTDSTFIKNTAFSKP